MAVRDQWVPKSGGAVYGDDVRGDAKLPDEAPLANVIEETASRLSECHIVAANLRAALFGPEPEACGKMPPPNASGAIWEARRNLDSAIDLMRALNDLLRAVAPK